MPSRAKYEDWIGISRCVAATSALTVKQPERRRAVDDDVRIVPADRLQPVLQAEMRVELPDQLGLELRERDPGRRDPEIRLRRGHDHVGEAAVRLDDRVVHAACELRDVEIRHRAVGLGIEVDEERPLTAQRQRGSEVDGGCGLSDAAFLVRDGDDHVSERWKAYTVPPL